MTRGLVTSLGFAGLLVGAIALLSAAALAYDDAVADQCTDDYLAHCSQHDPDSTATRRCMEAHRSELSQRCVKALVAAGEVPAKYLRGDRHRVHASEH